MRVLPFAVLRSWSSPAALLVVLAGLSACGVSRSEGPDRSEQLLTSVAPRSTSCVAESFPPELPGVDAVVDSARLATGVGELRRQEPAPTGYVLLTLAFDQEGVNIRREVIEHSTVPQVADSIQRLVFAARHQVDEAEQEWGVRLRIDLEEPVRLRVGQREYCPAVPRDRAIADAMRGFNPVGVRYRGGVRERIVHVRAWVNELGIITSARIERGELGGSSLERSLADYLRQFLFQPATIDGIPTGSWVIIPVRIPG